LPQKAQILPGLNLLRETNNAVFLDIGWAHEAYVQEGINAVETAIGANPEFRALKDGFRQIEAGRQLQMGGQADAARERIWSGNLKLLEHEQRDIVQKQVARATVLFDTFLSATTEIRYWANPFHIHPTKMTVFSLAMLVFNLPFLITHNFVPNFSDIDHRWEWIVKRVIPIFQRLDGSDPEIMSSIAEIIATGSQVLTPLAHTPGTAPMAPPG
jgi:hypothetical protein